VAHLDTDKSRKLKDSVTEYLAAIPWQNPIALSLTLKQRVKQQEIDLYLATSNFRHFMNRLNRRAFGNGPSRFGNGLRVISVHERDELVRLHNHAIVDRPDHMDFDQFKSAVEECWLKTTWGYRQMHIVPVTSNGWTRYITKSNQKPEYDLAIDWMNARIH
jgi:hypothetical protein